MSIGERIWQLRTAKGLSQEELAERLEVSRQSVSKWETDGAVPELDKLMRLCDLFHITMDELTGRSTVANPVSLPPAVTSNRLRPAQVVGIVLLSVGMLVLLLGVLLSPISLFSGLYVAVCGFLCLMVKRRLWLWLLLFSVIYFGLLAACLCGLIALWIG